MPYNYKLAHMLLDQCIHRIFGGLSTFETMKDYCPKYLHYYPHNKHEFKELISSSQLLAAKMQPMKIQESFSSFVKACKDLYDSGPEYSGLFIILRDVYKEFDDYCEKPKYRYRPLHFG